MTSLPRTGLQLRSLVKASGELELALAEVEVPTPAEGEVLLRVEAAPINPSDLVQLFAGADLDTLRIAGSAHRPVLTAQLPPAALRKQATRVGAALPAGSEGCGVVVAAGHSPAAQALVGKTVAVYGGGTYSQYRAAPADACLVLPQGTTPAEGASSFVNPLSALCMVETMRIEGHRALVHTAAASNLGQMLHRLCLEEGIDLVNVVRKPEQAALLRSQGAKFVVDTSAAGFEQALLAAIDATNATIAFDAIGGGQLAGQILTAMETSLVRKMTAFNRYGSPTHKQVYSYGLLDTAPAVMERASFGMSWGWGSWLMSTFLQKTGPETALRLKERIAANLKTTFATRYTREVSLAQALSPAEIGLYSKLATGEKYLVRPSADH